MIARVREALGVPERAPDDWSIDWSVRCTCKLCQVLKAFLTAPTRRTFDWPLASSDRAHVHGKIEYAELPVTHQTRRTVRPYTLVLNKTSKPFEQRAAARRQLEDALARLTAVPALSRASEDNMELFRAGEEVSSADLAALGLPRETYQRWVQARLLEATGRRGIYRATRALNAVLLNALVALRCPPRPPPRGGRAAVGDAGEGPGPGQGTSRRSSVSVVRPGSRG